MSQLENEYSKKLDRLDDLRNNGDINDNELLRLQEQYAREIIMKYKLSI